MCQNDSISPGQALMFGIRVACCEINSTSEKSLPAESALKAINNPVDAHQNVRYNDILDLLPALNSLVLQFCCGRDIVNRHITAFNRLVGVVGTPLLRPWFWAPDHGRGDPGFGTNLAKLRRVVVVACLVRISRGIGKSSNPGH
ncbi:hypothetical protein ARMSODRAFT_390214 [Armillaria solidipes]|uniref:Uncharacterized protein n=1 Tax=Armillaria solidipes TaxID=1076256 RepID=A0A2H3C899_9AGAR|nr:hypothetical protein ARMSODRAFT_390214 [Armillaria solidipes]